MLLGRLAVDKSAHGRHIGSGQLRDAVLRTVQAADAARPGSSSLDHWYRQRYHVNVANAGKILSRMRNNPRDWRIEDLKVLANRYGINHDQTGSHVTFRHPVVGRLTVPADRPIQPIYVRKFVQFVDSVIEEQQ